MNQEGTSHEAHGTREEALVAKPHNAQVEALTDALAASLRGVVEGLDSDLRTFAHHIAADLAGLPLVPDPEERQRRLGEIASNARALAGVTRIRAAHAAWDTVSLVIHTAARTLLAVAITA
ncbi:MAG: hypothetical protein KF684_04125 [Phycisphaeraceae bacterium]|nr:hypothetical protein [Phycisphaeraceae bacterium]